MGCAGHAPRRGRNSYDAQTAEDSKGSQTPKADTACNARRMKLSNMAAQLMLNGRCTRKEGRSKQTDPIRLFPLKLRPWIQGPARTII